MSCRITFLIATVAVVGGAAPLYSAQPRKPSEEPVEALLRKLGSKEAEDRVEALAQFERVYGGWNGVGTPSDWEKARLFDLRRALCDPEETVRLAAAKAFVRVARRADRLAEPVDYLISTLTLKFDDPVLAAAAKTPGEEKLWRSARARSAAALATVYKDNAAALPVVEQEAKKDGFTLTGAGARLSALKEAQRRIEEEAGPVLAELRKSADKELAAVAAKALEVIDPKGSK